MMPKRVFNLYMLIHTLGDLFILNIAFVIGHLYSFQTLTKLYGEKYIWLWAYLNIIYLISAKISGTFEMYRNSTFYQVLSALFKLFFFQVLMIFSYIVVFKDVSETFNLSREVLLITYTAAFLFTLIWRFGLIKVIRYLRARGFNNRNVLIVGAGSNGQEIRNMLFNRLEYGFNFVGFFDNDKERFPELKEQILGDIEDAKSFAVSNDIEEIFCALPYKQEDEIRDLIHFCDENLIRLKIVPDFTKFLNMKLSKVHVEKYGMFPVLSLRDEPLENAVNRVIKRIFDFGFTILVFALILWWLIPIIALLIKITSKGPVFFIQDRSGERNESFKVWKFRTMYMDNKIPERQAQKGDSRITPLGSFLRKSSLDEIPQFINVLFGQMSVIGPRPHMISHTEEYKKIIDKFMVRHFIKPGITGWAQVNGHRGETKDPRQMEARVQHDVWYIENWSLFLDIRIIFMTIFNLFKGEENAY